MPKCLQCGKEFKIRFRSNEKYCSQECCYAYYHPKDETTRHCVICGKKLIGRQQKYCGYDCRKRYVVLQQMNELKELTQAKDTEAPKVVKRKKKPKYTLAQINDMARAEGLNYGQYVAKYGL